MSAGASQLDYNGIRIYNCETREFRQESVLDPSGTDQMFHKYTITVVGYIHGGLPGASASVKYLGIKPDPGNQNAAQHHRQIRSALMAPRGELIFTLGEGSGGGDGTVLLAARPFQFGDLSDHRNRDVCNGPHPKHFDIVHIAGNNVLRVTFTVECHLIHCGADDTGLGRRDGVLNNRWSCTDTIDGNMFTVRRWQGSLRLATAIYNAHQFRGNVVPRVAAGFRRESMDFEVTPDGLNLNYTIVDREVYAAPPAPATDWRVTHSEGITAENSLTAHGTVTVELWGDRNADKRQLMRLGIVIANQRLDFLKNNVNADDKAFIRSVTVTDHSGSVGENKITFFIDIVHQKGIHPQDAKNQVENENAPPRVILNLQTSGWGVLPPADSLVDGYHPDKSRGSREGEDIELEGPALSVGAFVAHLQSICANRYSFEDALPVEEEPTPEESPAVPDITARVVETVSEETAEWASESHLEHIYTHWSMDTSYSESENTIGLPFADSSRFDRTGSGSSSGSGNDNTLAVIHLSAPTCIRVVKVKGERIGEPPEMPKVPTSFEDDNGVKYTRKWVGNVILTTGKGPGDVDVYTQQMEMEFWMSRPFRNEEERRVGVNPWSSIGLENSPESTYSIEEF